MDNIPYFVAVFGGAVSGAEAAFQLANRGIRTVVFEQNTLPYGKIEDGLPKWHVKLRDKEESNINEKMNHPLISYVPNTALGREVDFDDVAGNWGFSAVLLATGAWKDRPLPVEGIDALVNKGLYYQNPFIHWFNHYHEPTYNGPKYEIPDGAIVVGGGLASIDVVKVLMMETAKKKLAEKGIETNILELDKGIDRVLQANNLTFKDLGLKGCTLYYRRRDMDMPLSPQAANTPELLQKAQAVRAKILNNAQSKFFFHFEGCRAPVDMITENGRLAGMVFRETRIEGDKVVAVEGSRIEVRAPLVISSIGSIPEPIPGVPQKGQTFRISDEDSCQVEGYPNVFALGNAVTGRGNIKESFHHGHTQSKRVMDGYLDWTEADYSELLRQKETAAGKKVSDIVQRMGKNNVLSEEQLQKLEGKVKELQQKAGYDGNYNQWVEKHLPKRLEAILEIAH